MSEPNNPEKTDNKTKEQSPSVVIKFPQSKTRPKTGQRPLPDLGMSNLAKQLNISRGLQGHWCSRCKGIWYGFSGECECPVCGNRHG